MGSFLPPVSERERCLEMAADADDHDRPAAGTRRAHAGASQLRTVRNWAALADYLAAYSPVLILLDVDPATAGWRANASELRAGFRAAEGRLAPMMDAGCTLVWATNSTRASDDFGDPPRHTPGGHRLIFAARKPFLYVLRRELGTLPRGNSIVVVGDQWLTDGLLAHRLGATFLRWEPRGDKPISAKIKHTLGRLVVRPFVRRR